MGRLGVNRYECESCDGSVKENDVNETKKLDKMTNHRVEWTSHVRANEKLNEMTVKKDAHGPGQMGEMTEIT